MITVATLIAAGVEPTPARRMADPLRAACALFAIVLGTIGAYVAGGAIERVKEISAAKGAQQP